ncbi:uncharacterized protein LOC144121544 [Amblyomma americanum]
MCFLCVRMCSLCSRSCADVCANGSVPLTSSRTEFSRPSWCQGDHFTLSCGLYNHRRSNGSFSPEVTSSAVARDVKTRLLAPCLYLRWWVAFTWFVLSATGSWWIVAHRMRLVCIHFGAYSTGLASS